MERFILHEGFHCLGRTSKKFDFLVFKVSLLAMSQSEIFPSSAFTVSSISFHFICLTMGRVALRHTVDVGFQGALP